MASVSRRRLAKELVRLLDERPQDRAMLVRQTAAYLIDHKQTAATHLLVNDIANELQETQQHVSANIRSAFGLNDSARQAITSLLQQVTGAQTVELQESVDPGIIGGVVVRTPQLELDASVKRQIAKLAGGLL